MHREVIADKTAPGNLVLLRPDGRVVASTAVGSLPDLVTFDATGLRLLVANEGDVREWPGLTGAVRLGNAAYPLDPTVFPNAAALKANAALGRLNVSLVDGKSPAGTAYRTIYAYGGRSFSIWSADDGRLVWDSGDDFERVTAQALPSNFNSNNDEDNFDTRSDDRNPGQALSQLTRSILPVQDTFTWYRRARTRKSETHP